MFPLSASHVAIAGACFSTRARSPDVCRALGLLRLSQSSWWPKMSQYSNGFCTWASGTLEHSWGWKNVYFLDVFLLENIFSSFQLLMLFMSDWIPDKVQSIPKFYSDTSPSILWPILHAVWSSDTPLPPRPAGRDSRKCRTAIDQVMNDRKDPHRELQLSFLFYFSQSVAASIKVAADVVIMNNWIFQNMRSTLF